MAKYVSQADGGMVELPSPRALASPLSIIKIVEEMSRLHERFFKCLEIGHSFKAAADAYNTPAYGSSTRLKMGSFHRNATRILLESAFIPPSEAESQRNRARACQHHLSHFLFYRFLVAAHSQLRQVGRSLFARRVDCDLLVKRQASIER